MSDCLSPEDIDLLSNRDFRGKNLFTALKHLEKCEKCRSQIKLPLEYEVLKRLQTGAGGLLSSSVASASSK